MSDDLAALLASGRLTPALVDLLTALAGRAADTDRYRQALHTDLSVYLDHPEWTELFERDLAEPEPLDAISQVATRLAERGTSEDELRAWLTGYHLDLRSQDRESDEDTVLELLDELTGF